MPLGRLDVLAVGGLFGAVGYLINWGFVATGAAAWTDSIAATVVVSAFAARLLFGRSGLFGSVPAPDGRDFIPTPPPTGCPWHANGVTFFIGAAVGLFAAFLCHSSGLGPGREVLGFALST